MDTHEHTSRTRWLQSKHLTWIVLGVLVLGVLGLITGQATQLLGLWPFAFLLLCPLMMFFMMKGMQGMGSEQGGHDEQSGSDQRSREEKEHRSHESREEEGW